MFCQCVKFQIDRVVVVPRCFLSVLCCSMSTPTVPAFREDEEETVVPDRRNDMRTRSERRVWVSHRSPHPVGSLAPSIQTRARSSGPVPSCVARGTCTLPRNFFLSVRLPTHRFVTGSVSCRRRCRQLTMLRVAMECQKEYWNGNGCCSSDAVHNSHLVFFKLWGMGPDLFESNSVSFRAVRAF